MKKTTTPEDDRLAILAKLAELKRKLAAIKPDDPLFAKLEPPTLLAGIEAVETIERILNK